MADPSGPKIRMGKLKQEPVRLRPGDNFTVTTKEIIGDASKASVSFGPLPETVRPGDALYLNDGFIQLCLTGVEGDDVHCQVVVQ
jgi:pyruvate kinase